MGMSVVKVQFIRVLKKGEHPVIKGLRTPRVRVYTLAVCSLMSPVLVLSIFHWGAGARKTFTPTKIGIDYYYIVMYYCCLFVL